MPLLKRQDLPPRFLRAWPQGVPLPSLYKLGAGAVLLGQEPVDEARQDLRWHLSVSHPSRLPTWEELRRVRDELVPADVCMAIPYPPRAWWLSIHPNCLHLWEIHDRELVDLWRVEGEHARRIGKGEPEPARRHP